MGLPRPHATLALVLFAVCFFWLFFGTWLVDVTEARFFDGSGPLASKKNRGRFREFFLLICCDPIVLKSKPFFSTILSKLALLIFKTVPVL